MNKILLIDDETQAFEIIKSGLSGYDFDVSYESNHDNAINSISTQKPDAILLDIMFNGEPKGKAVLEEIKKSRHRDIPVIILTSTMRDYKEADYPDAAFPFAKDAFREGNKAFNDLSKQIKDVINKSDSIASDDSRFGFIVGSAPAMHDVCRTILNVAQKDTTVLITGETGTGKETVARAIHNHSYRKGGEFVPVNCGTFPEENLLVSELFGHERGSFTGATETRRGIFETASNGTVFLDEIGEVMPKVQVMLLRTIQEREIKRLGSSTPIKINVRLIAATNKNLEEDVKSGHFREDLYYRLNVVKIHLPPLRERPDDDLRRFFGYFVINFNKKHEKSISDILNDELFKVFRKYNWPGNIREFENRIESAIVRKRGGNVLLPGDFEFTEEEPLSIDVSSIANKFLKGEIDENYFIDHTKGETRKALVIEVYNKLRQQNGKKPTSEDLANVFNIKSGNMRQKLLELELGMPKLDQQYKEKFSSETS